MGVLIYHVLLGWDIFDSLYFLVIALSTVGYGDFVPRTPEEQIFTSFFLIVGFFMFGAFIAMQVSAVASHTEHMTRARNLRAARDMNASKSSNFLLSRLSRMSRDIFRSLSTAHKGPSATNLASLGTINESDRDEDLAAGLIAQGPLLGSSNYSPPRNGAGNNSESSDSRISSSVVTTAEASTADMKAYLLKSYDQDIVQVRTQAYLNIAIASLIVLVGMGCMISIESWSTTTAFYWACQTITTVGFGDVVPKTTGGRVFAMFFVLGGCGFLAKSVTDFVKYPLLLRERRHEKRLLDQFESTKLTAAKLHSMFHSDFFDNVPNLRRCETELSKAEFVLLVLQLMGKVREQDILLVASMFDKMDAGATGVLSQDIMTQQLDEAALRDRQLLILQQQQQQQQQQWGEGDSRGRRGSIIDIISSALSGGSGGDGSGTRASVNLPQQSSGVTYSRQNLGLLVGQSQGQGQRQGQGQGQGGYAHSHSPSENQQPRSSLSQRIGAVRAESGDLQVSLLDDRSV